MPRGLLQGLLLQVLLLLLQILRQETAQVLLLQILRQEHFPTEDEHLCTGLD
jgi:hypothetical protein